MTPIETICMTVIVLIIVGARVIMHWIDNRN